MWHDQPDVQVVVQVSDSIGDVHCAPTRVVVRIVPDSILASVVNIIPQVTCTTSVNNGLCEATVPLPTAWFSLSLNSATVSVDIRLLDSLAAPTTIGTVTVNPQPSVDFVNNLAMVLPASPLSPSHLFTAPVYAHASFHVATFSVRCFTSALSVEAVQIDQAVWMSEVRPMQYQGGQEVGVVAVLRDPESVTGDLVVQPELIFSLQLRVLSSASPGSLASINCTTLYLSNIYNEKIQPDGHVTPTPSLIIDSNLENSPTVGEVRVAQDVPKALFSYPNQAQIVNTAVYSGVPVTIQVNNLIAMSSGLLVPASGVSCQWDSPAFTLTSQCNQIMLNGSESVAADSAVIITTVSGFSSSLTVRVWFPSSRASLQSTPSTLSPVQGWVSLNFSGQCSQQYQRGMIQANSLYSYSASSPVFSVNILPLLSSQLTSSNPSVVALGDDGMLQALSPGVATISAGDRVSPVVVTATDTPVQVSALDVTVFSGLSINFPTPPYPIASSQLASVVIEQSFDSITSPVYIVALAAISDGTVMLLQEEDTLSVVSLDETVIQSVNDVLIAVGTGTGELVRIDWTSVCTGETIASGHGLVDARVPNPVSIEVTLSSQRITYSDNIAALGNVPISSTLSIRLVYPDGFSRDVTEDSQTVISVTQGRDLVNLGIINNVLTITPSDQNMTAVGEVSISISFGLISENVSVTVVTYERVRMLSTPFPAYPGSSSVSKSTLNRIEQTSIYQAVSLELDILLSDSSSVRVTDSPLAFFQTSSSELSLSGNIVSASQVGLFEVRGQFGPDMTALQLTVTDDVVLVTSFLTFSALIDENTFSGVVGSTAGLKLDVQFSDSTIYPNFLPDLAGSLTNLLSLTTDTPEALTILPRSASLRLRGNHHTAVTVTVAKLTSSQPQTQVSFACNLEPAVGDVDLGALSGVPLLSLNQGSSLSVPVYVNVGTQHLTRINLALAYDFERLGLSAVRPSWPGTLQHTDTPSTGLLTLTGSHQTGVSGLIQLGTLGFDTLSTGIATIGGLVLELSDNQGLPIGERGPREFVAGQVSVDIRPGVSKRSINNRARRNVACSSTPPCETCPDLRERGDTNGDCVFDSSDPEFLLSYFAEEAFQFQLSSGMTLQASLIPQQLDQFDADLNTAVDPQDVYFLQQTEFGLLNFISAVSVLPVQNNPSCTIVINCTLLTRTGQPPLNALVFFDLSFPFDPTFTQQQRFEQSLYIRGDPVVGASKGLALQGGLVEAAIIETGVFGIELQTNLTVDGLGVSIIQVTSDDDTTTNHARTRAVFGDPDPPYAYPSSLDLSLPVFSNEARIIASNGYSPLTTFDSTFTTLACLAPPAPPFFNQTLYVATIPEDAQAGMAVLTVLAISNSPFPAVYSIASGNVGSVFQVNETSGVLFIAGTLDFETMISYTLSILATDPATGFFSTARADVILTDVNDNKPFFTEFQPEITIPANTPVGSLITAVVATDPDSGESGIIRYGIQSDTFIIDTLRGVITLSHNLNFDVQSNYTVIVSATDQGVPPLSTNMLLHITILPPDPTVLEFEQAVYMETIAENSPSSTVVLQVAAFNIAGESDGSDVIEYTIATTEQIPFDIDSMSGEITVSGVIDREDHAMYQFQVRAVVANESRAIPAFAAVFISVLDENDNSPRFEQDTYQATLLENRPPGTLQLVIAATDPDEGQNANVTYSLQTPSVVLTLDSLSGVITNIQSIDYETVEEITIVVVASDGGSVPQSSLVNVTIAIVDVNDNSPMIQLSSPTVTLREDVSVGTTVVEFNVTDLDQPSVNGGVQLSLLLEDPATLERTPSTEFSIDEAAGRVSVSASLDYERLQQYELIIVAVDGGELSSETRLRVDVSDVNDNPPVFTQPVYNLTVPEDTPVEDTLLTLTVTDRDSPLNSDTIFSLFTTDPAVTSTFNVTDTGVVMLAASLDFETQQEYQFAVLAMNTVPGADPTTANLTVWVTDVNEFPPVFTQEVYTATVVEESDPGMFVLQVFATDQDESAMLSFSLSLPEFQVTANGSIYTTQTLDRETISSYNFTVTVSDGGIPERTDSSIVMVHLLDINDNQPIITTPAQVTISETLPVGSVAFSLSASDSDMGLNGEINSFTLLTPTSVFNLSTTGELIIAQQLDAVTSPSHNLSIQVFDLGNPPLSSTFTLTVHVEPSTELVFDQALYSISIEENNDNDTFLLQVRAFSRHPMVTNISYSLNPISIHLGGLFSVESIVGNVIVLVPLDRESLDSYTLTVDAQAVFNGTILAASTQVNVTVEDQNDNAPMFENFLTVVVVPETVGAESRITTIQATDADISSNAIIEYSIFTVSEEQLFRISSNGTIFSTVPFLGRNGNYTLFVSVSNPPQVGPLNSTTQITVTVESVNSFPPLFLQSMYSIELPEDSAIGDVVLNVTAVDADIGTAGDISYHIVSDNSDRLFVIDSTTGTLTLNGTLDFETQQSYELTVEARDNGLPSLSSTIPVSLNITDVNDSPPVFTETVFTGQVVEEQAAGVSVLNLTYTDDDSPPNSQVVFTVEPDFFSIFGVSSDGNLRTLIALDRENVSRYEFTVTAVNEGGGIVLSGTTTVQVTVIDINDNAPQFSQDGYGQVIQAPIPVNSTLLLNIQANDLDATGPNSQFLFSLADFNDTFAVDMTTGVVTVIREIRSAANFSLTIQVTDQGQPSLSSTTIIMVTILPPDDLTAGRERDLVFTTERGVDLVGSQSETMVDTYQQLYGFVLGRSVLESRRVTASLGPFSSSLSVLPTSLPAQSVKAVLITSHVWSDDPVVQLAVQVRDEAGSVHTSLTTVTGVVTHPSSETSQSTCTTRTSDGTCVMSVSVPTDWFTSRENLTVQYGLSMTALATAGVTEVQPSLTFIDPEGDNIYVLMDMPLRNLFRGDSFSVAVYGEAGSKAVGSFTISVTSAISVTLTSLTVNNDIWQAQTEMTNNQRFTITAVRVVEDEVPPSERVLLFTINALVSSDSPVNQLLTDAIVSTVVDLSDSGRMKLLPPPGMTSQPSLALSRNGLTSAGAIFVANDETVGLLPYVSSPELVNTALLNAMPVSIPVTVLEVKLSGRVFASSSSSFSCETTDPAVVSVATDCSSVIVTTEHTQASTGVIVTVSQDNVSSSFPLHVWVPQTPLRVTLTDTTLNKIPGLYRAGSCSPVYQSVSLAVFADFTNSQANFQDVDVTDLITDLVSTSNESILSTSGRVVSGMSVGVAQLTYQSPESGRYNFSVDVDVTNVAMEILGLDVQVLTGLITTGDSVVERLSTAPLTVTAQQVFDFEGVTGNVISTAVFADGSRIILDPSSVLYQTFDRNVISISGTLVTALASGEGELIQATWMSPQECSTEPVATGRGVVLVNIPQPDSVDVTAQMVLTTPGSTAQAIGLLTATSVSVTAMYGTRPQDLSTDIRTSYIVPAGLTLNRTTDSVTLSVDSGASQGEYIIQIFFAQFPTLGQNITITIVELVDIALSASPFPVYPGSSTRPATTLDVVAQTGRRQQALVAASGVLSNGDRIVISSHPELTFSITGNLASVSSIDRSSAGNVLTVLDALLTEDRFVSVSARLREVTSLSSLRFTISFARVEIISIVIEPFPSNIFRGVVDVAQHQVVVSLTFDDGTRYVNLFRDNFLSNFVTFSASPLSAVTIDSITGIATIRGNSLSMATITVDAVGTSIDRTISFHTNLDPDTGDVDLGMPTGTPLPSMSIGSQFTVPVRVNAGSFILDSIEVDVTFDPSILRALSVSEGPDWPASGVFDDVINDPVSVVTLGGTLVGGSSVSGLVHLAEITFEVVGGGLTDVSGVIHTLAEMGVGGTAAPNIGTVPRSFIAGSVQFQTSSGTGKRDTSFVTARPHHRPIKRQTACSPDSPRQTGDVDGNCEFDVRDASFLQLHILRTVSTGTPPPLPADQSVYLDIDGSGEVDTNDVVFMLRVAFGLLRFFTNPMFTAVEDSTSCQISFNVTLLRRGDIPASNSSTYLVVDIAHTDSGFQDEFDNSNFTSSAMPISKGIGLYGGLVEADYLGGGVYGFTMNSAISRTSIGLSLIMVTFDGEGMTSPVRTATLFSQAIPVYNSLDVSFSLQGQIVSVSTQLGYSPLFLYDSTQTTSRCFFERLPLRFRNETYLVDVAENTTIGSEILTVTAVSTRPSPQIVYSLNTSSTVPFSIDPSTGRVVLTQTLDFETLRVYTLEVLASEDNDAYTARAELVVMVTNVNDIPPTVNQTALVEVLASRSRGDVAQVVAVDPDGLDQLSFTLVEAHTQFQVNQSTGVVSVLSSLMSLANTIVSLNISITDSLFTVHTTVSLDVFMPAFAEQDISVTIPEDTLTNNIVANVSIVNRRDLQFTFTSGDPSFSVTGTNGGVVTVAAVLDFEVQPLHLVIITATSPSINITVTITVQLTDVNDNPPTFPEPIVNITLNSSTLIGTQITRIVANDIDSGINSEIAYSLVPSSPFTLDPTTGDLTLADTLLGSRPPLELTVTATDRGTVPLVGSVRVVIDVIFPAVTPFPILPTFTASNGGLLLSEPQRGSDRISQSFSKLHNLSPTELQATFPGINITATTSVASTLQEAISATAVLLQPSGMVYQESPTVSVGFQVRDSDHLTTVVNTVTSVVALTPERNSSDPCVPDQYGLCVVTFTVPEGWFTTMPVLVTLEPLLNGLSVGNPIFLNLQPTQPINVDIRNGLVAVLPSRDIVSGQIFTVDVSAYISHTVVGFSVTFELHPSIELTDVVIDTSQWGVSMTSNTNTVGIVAIVATPVDQTTPSNGSPSPLLSLQLRAVSAVAATLPISGSVHSLSDALEGSVILDSTNTTSGPVVFLGREGMGTIGNIHVVPNTLLALFPYSEQVEVLNTAALDGVPVSVPIQLFAGYSSGEVMSYEGGDVSCTSNSTVISTDSMCSSLLLTGVESAGSDLVSVSFDSSGINASLPLRVYYPKGKLRMVTSDNTLHRIQYTLADSCTAFQQATLSVYAEFTAGVLTLTNVDVTNLLPPYIANDESTILRVDGNIVYGQSPGTSVACAGRTIKVDCIPITVSTDPVNVANVIGSMVVDATIITNSSIAATSVESALLDIRSQLQFEQERGVVMVALQYTDGTYSPADLNDLTLVPVNPSLYSTESGQISARESGSSDLVYQWRPLDGACRLTVSETVTVTADLPPPVSVRTSLTPPPLIHTLTTPQGDAELAGIPTVLNIAPVLVYANNATLTVSNDSRIRYDLSNALVTVSSTGEIRATGQGTGVTHIGVTFSPTNLTAEIVVEVVRAAGLIISLTPYPSYPGSEDHQISILSPLENSGSWQRGVVVIHLNLTNGQVLNVTSLPDTALNAEDLPGTGPSRPDISDEFILSVSTSGLFQITASFGSIPDQVIVVTAADIPVGVVGLSFNPLSAKQLTGIAGIPGPQASLTLLFSDSTTFTDYPSSTLPSNLVNFSTTSNTFTVSSSGVLTPLANSLSPVTLMAVSGDGSVSNSTTFTVDLEPGVGDVDLIPPVGEFKVGHELAVPVTVNSGGLSVGAVELTVSYDDQVLSPMSGEVGPDWTTGVYEISLYDSTGMVRLGGVLTADGVAGANLHLFTLHFTVIGPSMAGETYLRGEMITLSERSEQGLPIGQPTPRPFVAGDVIVLVESNRKRAAPISPREHRARRQVDECPTFNCDCSGVSQGDVDGNCVFDLRDVSFALVYLSESLTGTGSMRPVFNLDQNSDNAMDATDVYFLFRAAFGLVHHLQSVEITPVEDVLSSCLFSVRVILTSRYNLTSTRADVLIDLSLDSQSSIAGTTVSTGSLLAANKGSGLSGAVYLAESAINVYTVQLNAEFVSSMVGVSIAVVTYNTRGQTNTQRVTQFFGPPPPTVGPLSLTLQLSADTSVSLSALSGYSPLRTVSNALRSSQCSDSPLLGSQLDANFLSPFQVVLEWNLNNRRMGLNFSQMLRVEVEECSLTQAGDQDTCSMYTITPVDSNTNHSLSTTPFTGYTFQVLSLDGVMSTDSIQERSPESPPVGVDAPTYEHISEGVVLRWTLPSQPYGIITHYTVRLDTQVVFNGSSLIVALHNPITIPTNVSLEAHNSAGSTLSPTAVIPPTDIVTATPEPGLSVAITDIIIVCVVLSVILIVVLVVGLTLGMTKEKWQWGAKDKPPPILSLDFSEEMMGVVSACNILLLISCAVCWQAACE